MSQTATRKLPLTHSEIADVERVLNTLTDVVAEAGADYAYTRYSNPESVMACTYVRDGKPDCIAARVLHKLGVPIEKLAALEGKRCDAIDPKREFFTSPALAVLRYAQTRQDNGETWGEALAAAKDVAFRQYHVAID